MPRLAVFVIVKVFTPLDQVVDLVFEQVVVHDLELSIIEGVLVERFKLFLEAS